MNKFLTLFVFLLITSFVSSQNATVSGKVVDENNESLFAVTVVADVNAGLATQSDLEGKYELSLAPGKYALVFSFIGKESVTKEVNLSTGEKKHLNVVLAPSNVEIEVVTVTSGKYEKKFGEEVVSMEIIPTNIISNNVAQAQEALNKVPGYQNIGESPSIRGGSSFASGASSRTLF